MTSLGWQTAGWEWDEEEGNCITRCIARLPSGESVGVDDEPKFDPLGLLAMGVGDGRAVGGPGYLC
jgi:hypothetical protein